MVKNDYLKFNMADGHQIENWWEIFIYDFAKQWLIYTKFGMCNVVALKYTLQKCI